jgi:hypothetical protein
LERELDSFFNFVFFFGVESVLEDMQGGEELVWSHGFGVLLFADLDEFVMEVIDVVLAVLPCQENLVVGKAHLGVLLDETIELVLRDVEAAVVVEESHKKCLIL